MRRSRRTRLAALALCLSGFLLAVWAGTGAAAVAAAGPSVTLKVKSKNVLALSCSDPSTAGYRDGFCQADAAGYLVLDFSQGYDDGRYGLQPGSTYAFGDVMYIKHIGSKRADVTVQVSQQHAGSLSEVLKVVLTGPNGQMFDMFPPDSGNSGQAQTITMNRDDIMSLSFDFTVDDQWVVDEIQPLTNGEDSFELTGSIVITAGVEDDPETPVLPPEQPDPPPRDDEFPPDDPGSGPDTDPGDDTDIDTPPPSAGPLPFTGGNHWPYIALGMLMMVTGAWLYFRTQPIAEAE